VLAAWLAEHGAAVLFRTQATVARLLLGRMPVQQPQWTAVRPQQELGAPQVHLQRSAAGTPVIGHALTILGHKLGCLVHDGPDVRGWQDHADGFGLCEQLLDLLDICLVDP
jgi:hypothetical protein